ncbi:MAG: LEPR-XLL domain-containing protein [Betaproteobacteria bacterium]|nr:LEPR-XLL domain-containing protein [Betaproteobacteria bacterium]
MSIHSQSTERTPISIPSLAELFSGRLGQHFRAMADWRKRGLLGKAAQHKRRRSRMRMEAFEPRILLSADFLPVAADGIADGLNQLGNETAFFLNAEDQWLSDRVPILLEASEDANGDPVYESPTVRDLLSVPVNANGDLDTNGDPNIDDPFWDTDNDEAVLDGLDVNNDGVVDPGEFVQAWFFNPIEVYLHSVTSGDTTEDFTDFLKGSLLADLDHTLTEFSTPGHPSDISKVEFEIVDAKVFDTTEDPDAEFTFSVGFALTITQAMPIDLGLQADALKILPFTGTADNSATPKVPVNSSLSFAFDFGIHTGGQDSANINGFDFFVRKAEPILASVVAGDTGLNFNLNVGFLGASVVNGSLDLQADVETQLLDPDDPVVLGFTDAQLGVEQTGGSVTAANPLVTANLAHEAGFFLRIGNLGISTPLAVADNNSDGDPLSAVTADIDAALVAAGLGDLVDVSLDAANKVRFDLVATTATPLGFPDESLAEFGTLLATPDGDGPNIYEFNASQTFLLSLDGALPKLVTVRFPDPSRTDIGFANDQTAAASALVAPSAASVFDVSGDANFTVTVRKSDGTEESVAFTLTATETDGNASAAALAQDIDDQMLGSAVWPLVLVSADGDGHIRFNPLDGTSAIRVQASGTATSEIGFAADASATLGLLAADTAVANLSDAARFKLTLTSDTGGGTSTATSLVVVPDNNRASLNDLATDINAAIDSALGANRIDVFVSGGKILLKALDANVLAFSVTTINENLGDLVGDVNQALTKAGFAGQVTASNIGGQLALTAAGSKSLEISRTLTFDAGVTYAELLFEPTADLFDASEGADSKVHMKLPVKVLPGLYDEIGAAANWNPANVAIVANFDPFLSNVAEFDKDITNRFELDFSYTPEPGVPDQDSPAVPVPTVASLTDEVRLVNFGELLNFNIVGAESMIGLLGGLGTALQQLSDSIDFTTFEIPFADATLSDLLNIADTDKKRYSGLIDLLMFDTGGDGVDGTNADANKLLKKITVDSTSYLVPSFSTAQTLAARLDALIDGPLSGFGGINATYDKTSNELTYQIDLQASDRTAVPTTVTFEHDVELDPFTKLTIDYAVPPAETSVDLRGRSGLGMTFGVDLTPPGAVIFESTELADLHGDTGVDIRAEAAVTGETGVRSVFGITRDSTFKISLDGGPAYDVDLSAASTDTNTSIQQLANDIKAAINTALNGTPYAGLVLVGWDAGNPERLGIQHANPGGTIQIDVASSDPFVTELGFPNRLTSGEPTPFHTLIAQKDAPLLVGRLSGFGPATFQIDILKDHDGNAVVADPVTVTVTVDATSGNVTIQDLVADVDNALIAAGLGGKIKAGFDNSSSHGSRLVLIAGDGDPLTNDTQIEFTVRATNTKAHDELGLPNVATAANRQDFVIFDRAGIAHPITLDPAGLDRTDLSYDPKTGLPNDPTVGDVIKVINAWFPDPDGAGLEKPLVEASFNGTHTGLRLVTSGAGPEQFRVETINASGSLIGLGLFLTGDDDLPDTFGHGDPNLIEGGGIGLTRLDQRFFVRDAQLRIDGVQVKTPDAGVPGEGLYGIVGVDATVTGSLLANVTAQLTDPANSLSWKNQITLTELLDKETGGTLAHPVVSKVTELAYDDTITGGFNVGGRVEGATSHATAVIVGIVGDDGASDPDGKLQLANVKGFFQNDEILVGTKGGVLSGGAYANGTASAAADFGSFDLDITVQPGFGDLAFDPADFGALDGASYTVPFKLTGFGEPFGPTAPATSALDLSLLGDLEALDKLSYDHFAAALGGLLDVLNDVQAGFTQLTTPLPAINRSVSDLLSLVAGFERGVANADARFDAANEAIGPDGLGLPALRLQDMGRALRGAFGLADGANPLSSGAVDWVLLDYAPTNGEVLLSMQLHEDVSTKLGLDIVTGPGLPHLTSAGVLEVSGHLDTRLHVAIDLADPTQIDLLNVSRIDGALHVQGEGQEYVTGDDGLGMVFRSSIGPLAVFIQDGDALIDFEFSLPGLDFGGSTRKALASVEFADFKPPFISKSTIDIVLPMFYGGEGPDNFIGEYKAIGTVGSVAVTQPDFSKIVEAITAGTQPYDPFENILLAIDTLDLYLESMSDQLSSDVLGIELPFIGDQMADVLFIEDFRSTLIRELKNGVENAVNPTAQTVTDILSGLFGTGGALDDYVTGAVLVSSQLLGPAASRYRQWNFTIAHTGTNADTIVVDDFDIGPDHMGFDIKAPVTVKVDWSVEIGFGVDFGNGAYIEVSDADEVDVGLTITMPTNMASVAYQGELGYLGLNVTDPGPASGAKVNFVVNVDGDSSAGRLGFADLGSLNPLAKISGDALNGIDSAATFHLVTRNSAGMPDLQADLVFDWHLDEQGVAGLNGDAVTQGITLIALNSMKLDALSGLRNLVGDAFEEVAKYIEPFMPVVDILSAPIPILSDLAGEPFTLLDLAAIFGDVDPRFIEAVADILDVITEIDDLVNSPHLLDLGSLVLFDPNAGITNFDPGIVSSRLDSINVANLSTLSGMTYNDPLFQQQVNNMPLIDLLRSVEALDIPIVTDARQGIKMLLGESADLITYELPPLGVSFDYLQVFPVWGPLAVSIEISFGFTVDLHGVGFDTTGYMRYAEGGFRNPGLIFDGFFLSDGDLVTKADLPDVTFEFGLVGAAELNIGIARAGVGGGIDATIIFDWHDSIPDGNVHISELAGNVIAADGNPLAVFDVSGALTFQMFAFLEISLLGIDEEFPITPETELFSFNESFDRDPILATQSGDTLYLNMGPNAEDRLNGDTSDGNEALSLKYSGGKVYVWSSQLGVAEGDAQEFSGVKHIVGLGGEGNDTITLRDFDGSKITGDFDGGVGDDSIQYTSTSASNSWVGARIVGGLGNDTLSGGDANDVIIGGEGNDTIYGNGGYDILFGDQGRVADTVTVPFISSRITDSDGEDKIDGGSGDDVVIGAGGSDTLGGGEGTDLIIGDGGRFEYSTTGGHVNVAALRPAGYTLEDPGTYKDPTLISNQIDAIQDAVLDKIHATELGLGGNDVIKGGGGNDLVLGGTGDDDIEGNGGDDILLGGKGFDYLRGGTENDTMFGGDQADVMDGNAGNDVMSGDAGNDFMHGNDGNDVMKGGTGGDVMFGDAGDDQVFGQTEPDLLFGGADDDLVVGGTSNDVMFGDDGLVVKIDPNPAAPDNGKYIGMGSHSLAAGAFADGDIRTVDLIVTDVRANDGDDMMSGDAGDDLMFGGGGDDLMGGDVDARLPNAGTNTSISEDVLIGDGGKVVFNQRRFKTIESVIGADTTGTPFDDVIYGDNGNDYIIGGRGSDLLFGGHGKVVTDVAAQTLGAFRGATDANASDNDIIVGDNGRLEFAGSAIAANFGVLERVLTTDTANDTGGHEYAEGQLGDDVIFGGVNGSVDVLFGNVGNDVILGDNGELDFAFGQDTLSPLDDDANLNTLDLIRSYRDGLGGIDIISGNAGYDVLIGGTAGDEMYGDDATASSGAADGEDIMLGDNADIFLIGTAGRLKVRVAEMTTGTAVDLITTTDTAANEDTGGPDTMSGNAMADIMLGGVNNDDGIGDPEVDTMYGDRAVPTVTTIANDGDDILLGDDGLLDFTFPPDTTNRDILDLIRSFEDGLGGKDVISGNKGLDVAIGGTGGDVIYGDDWAASAGASDLGDLLLGDNADIFLVNPNGASGGDIKLVLNAAVKTIKTTDEENPGYGGSDTISGNAKGDIIAGGVKGDTLYGDRASPNVTTIADEGNDSILGDNGSFEWLSNGRFSEITGIDILANNADLYAKYGSNAFDTDLTTLDLITTEQPTSGGRDLIYGDQGKDVVFGGTDADTIYGDDGDETGDSANNDVLFGDHGRIYPQFPRFQLPNSTTLISANFPSRNFFAINVGNTAGGEGDRMWGEEGADVMLGQQGDDRMWGGSGDDDMTGGHNAAGGYDELTAPAIVATLNPQVNDLMDGGSGDDAMAGDNAIIWRRGDDVSPRFRLLTATSLYTTDFDSITTNVDTLDQSDPDDAVGRDIQLLDHSDAVQATPLGRFGNDVMAGGADSDVMFGELGNDLMQGDGLIGGLAVLPPYVTRQIDVVDTGSNPDTDETLYFNIPELATDADDYMEGNGGNDVMYGGLGQDDLIGGSSELFGLDGANAALLGFIGEQLRPDGSDVIYGGAGNPVRLARNDFVGATDTDVGTSVTVGGLPTADDPMVSLAGRHARDADFIMGDNSDVFRPVKAPDDFYAFNYDNYGTLKIVPRAMQQLDYTLGGADFAGGTYSNGVANGDNGLADLIHGESGDDYIFGMTGSDVIFGNSDDDDIVGGYGHDWISGGTGQDGVLGDDGLIRTSRNSTLGEPLYAVAPLLPSNQDNPKFSQGDVLDELIATPGNIQMATINISGELKKTADITPFSFDPNWLALDDEFPDNIDGTPFADDIIFGGLGSDFLHGGSGDDAISGAEALEHAYVPTYDVNGAPKGAIDLGYLAVGLPSETNPGDVLAFNSQDVDGQHLNNRFRAGEFSLYDEFDPRRKIQIVLTSSNPLAPVGAAYKGQTGVTEVGEYLLNFDKTEGVFRAGGTVPKATGQQTETYSAVNDDGRDLIFGDLGNDWLVGGTGRDDLFGGWGNDYLNADDNLETETTGVAAQFDNESPDTHPYYEDRAYGGAGRDVLVGNTGGDRLIDWVGEYNSYLVPYAPFGQASVSRTLMPHLHEFLYALSAGDGADPTRNADTGADAARNGEPDAEMGLVLQKDVAWQDQTGAPADPQAGNIPGGARDVLRSAGFNDGTLSGLAVDSGSFTVSGGALKVSAESLGKDAAAVFYVDEQLPSYYEFLASVKVEKPTAGWKANSFLIFDYFDSTDFKFAGVDISTNKLVIGYRDASGWQVVKDAPSLLKAGITYNMAVYVNGTNVTLIVDNKTIMSYTFGQRMIDGEGYGLNMGMLGLGSDNSRGSFDNVVVQRVPPAYTLQQTEEFTDGTGTLFDGETFGNWQVVNGRYEGTVVGGQTAYSLVDLGIDRGLETNAILELSGKLNVTGAGGFIFDRYADNDYKFVNMDAAADKVTIGHVSPQGGLKIDASFSKVIDPGIEYTLTLSLKGTSVSVSLAAGTGAASVVGGFVFNGVTLDGGFGLLSTVGKTSFDSVSVKTNDSAFTPPTGGAMLAAEAPAVITGFETGLTQAQLDAVLAASSAQWTKLLGAGDPRLALLANVRISVSDLNGLVLGSNDGTNILVDTDAAGYGWFVDTSPADSDEFRIRVDRNVLGAAPSSEAYGRMDLLTVVTHELGHVMGIDHDAGGLAVMDDDLEAGARYLLEGVPAADPQPSDTARVRVAETPAASKVPFAFDDAFNTGVPARNGVIDWGDGSGLNKPLFSPYASTKAWTNVNFSDFLVRFSNKGSSASRSI